MYVHHAIGSGLQVFEWSRNAMAGGVICPSNTLVSQAFGGFGFSTATATTTTGTGVTVTITTTATTGGEATVTWRSDIASNSTPVIQAARMAATTDDEKVWRGVQVAGVDRTSAAIWFLDRGSAATAVNVTVNGTAHVLIHGPFTGTQVS